jgi:hypothetical protein
MKHLTWMTNLRQITRLMSGPPDFLEVSWAQSLSPVLQMLSLRLTGEPPQWLICLVSMCPEFIWRCHKIPNRMIKEVPFQFYKACQGTNIWVLEPESANNGVYSLTTGLTDIWGRVAFVESFFHVVWDYQTGFLLICLSVSLLYWYSYKGENLLVAFLFLQ